MPLRHLLLSCLLALSILVVSSAPANATVASTSAERTVSEVLDSLGLPWGSVVNSWDLQEAASALGTELEEPPVPYSAAHRFGLDHLDLWREIFVRTAVDDLVALHRERLREPAERLGLDPGTKVDEADVRRLADHLGLDVGAVVSPTDVHNVNVVARKEAKIATPVMARVGDFVLRAPAQGVRAIGFHEAPRGEQRFSMTQVDERGFVMPSRGRRAGATSAVDVAMDAGTEVVSPIDGVVQQVVGYRLYGRYRDAFVRIRGDRYDVVVLHVDGVKVREGQRVEAGVTPIADGPRVFPFDSQVEEFVGRVPHVDVSVRPRG